MRFKPSSFNGAQAEFRKSSRGVATVELALILPIVIGILALATAGGQGFSIDRKVVLAAHTVADLVSGTPFENGSPTAGATQITQSELDTDIALSAEIMYPNAPASLQVVVSELFVDAAANTGTVIWSEGCNGATKLPVNSIIALDPSYAKTGAPYLIFGQASYTFQPLGILYPTATVNLSSTETLTIRNGAQITVQWGTSSCSVLS